MAKKTSNKEFKPKVEDKKEIVKEFPTTDKVTYTPTYGQSGTLEPFLFPAASVQFMFQEYD